MSNTIQIKHGSAAPESGDLAAYELGFSTGNNNLYIGNTSGSPIDLTGTKLDIYDTGREIKGSQYPSSDLNTYTTPGLYVCTSGNAENSTNSPIKDSGFKLVVIRGYNNYHLNQLIFAGSDSRVYARSAASSSASAVWNWKDWTKLSLPSLEDLGITASVAELNKLDGVTASTTELNYLDGATSNIQDQLNAKQVNILGIGVEIPKGSNLDNYTTPGKYYFPSSETNLATDQKITNSPFTSSGYGLIVMSGYITSRVWQIALGVNKIRHRYYNGSSWEAWKTITSS